MCFLNMQNRHRTPQKYRIETRDLQKVLFYGAMEDLREQCGPSDMARLREQGLFLRLTCQSLLNCVWISLNTMKAETQ